MSLRFHLFVSDVKQENEDFEYKKVDSRFFCIGTEMERFSLDLLRAVKKNVLWNLDVWVCGIRSRRLIKGDKLFLTF